jgi:hypothetical protein
VSFPGFSIHSDRSLNETSDDLTPAGLVHDLNNVLQTLVEQRICFRAIRAGLNSRRRSCACVEREEDRGEHAGQWRFADSVRKHLARLDRVRRRFADCGPRA